MRSMACSELKKFFLRWRGGLLLLGGLGVLGLVGWALWCIPEWQAEHVKAYPYQLAKLTDEYRRTLAQSIGGFFLLVGLYLGWLRVKAAQETVRVVEEGHITDRFTKAIAQLGDCKMAIRLGGIYALERTAKDSEKDHGPIMEVLTAYVRENAPSREEEEEDTPEAPGPPPTDIQAILTVIGRRETTDDNRLNNPLDLSYTQLSGANLTGANLTGANLRGADLFETDLFETDLCGVFLARVKHLTEAQVKEAKNWCKIEYWPRRLKHLKNFPEPSA